MAKRKTEKRPVELTESDTTEAQGGANVWECLVSSARGGGPAPKQARLEGAGGLIGS